VNLNRRRGGAIAKAYGNAFEALFMSACRHAGIHVVQIPMGAKVIRCRGKLTTIKVKTPFDFVLMKDGVTVMVDTKTVDGSTFPFSKITRHQLESLAHCEVFGVKAGYVVNFRETGQMAFFSSRVLSRLRPNASLIAEDGENLGNTRSPNLFYFVVRP